MIKQDVLDITKFKKRKKSAKLWMSSQKKLNSNKIQKIIKFKQEAWLRPSTDMNMEVRKN